MNNQNRKKQKKGAGRGVALTVLLFILLPRLFSLLDELDELNLRRFFMRLRYWWMTGELKIPLIAAILVIIAITVGIGAAKKRQVQMNSSAGRTSAAIRRPDPRTRSFTAPEAPCIVCDHTGEDHFERDKARRIGQLDEWVKNGLIDREEYRVLKDRYERDI